MNDLTFGADADAGDLHEKELYASLKDNVPHWAAQHKTPHHVEGEEGGEGEHRGGGDGGGGKRSWPTEVGDELSGHSSTLRSLKSRRNNRSHGRLHWGTA